MKYSNCFFYAINKWRKHGGYIAIRKSRYGWWPHFIWVEDLRDAKLEQYVPVKYNLQYKYIDKILFKGVVKTSDKNPGQS